MEKYNDIFGIVKDLHDFTFKKVIRLEDNGDADFSILDDKNVYRFDDDDPKKNGRFINVTGCCNDCKDCNTPDQEKLKKEKKDVEYQDFKLSYVSHGSHSIDFLRAGGLNDEEIKKEFEQNDWNTTPVLFLMENPSKNYGIYEERDGKYPTTTWYWVHRKLESLSEMQAAGDKYLKQGYYGDMVYSLICKNKLANAYLTNVVKCGMNKIWMEDGKSKDAYLGTWWYQDQCKKNCAINVLSEEIKRLVCGQKKLIVFTFGNNAYYLAKDLLQNLDLFRAFDKRLILLPHPSNRLNGTFRTALLGDYVTNALKTDSMIGSLKSIMKKKET